MYIRLFSSAVYSLGKNLVVINLWLTLPLLSPLPDDPTVLPFSSPVVKREPTFFSPIYRKSLRWPKRRSTPRLSNKTTIDQHTEKPSNKLKGFGVKRVDISPVTVTEWINHPNLNRSLFHLNFYETFNIWRNVCIRLCCNDYDLKTSRPGS